MKTQQLTDRTSTFDQDVDFICQMMHDEQSQQASSFRPKTFCAVQIWFWALSNRGAAKVEVQAEGESGQTMARPSEGVDIDDQQSKLKSTAQELA